MRGTRPKHFDSGLEFLYSSAEPGRIYSQSEIAAACGCTKTAIARIEHKAIRKLAIRIRERGLNHLLRELLTQ